MKLILNIVSFFLKELIILATEDLISFPFFQTKIKESQLDQTKIKESQLDQTKNVTKIEQSAHQEASKPETYEGESNLAKLLASQVFAFFHILYLRRASSRNSILATMANFK